MRTRSSVFEKRRWKCLPEDENKNKYKSHLNSIRLADIFIFHSIYVVLNLLAPTSYTHMKEWVSHWYVHTHTSLHFVHTILFLVSDCLGRCGASHSHLPLLNYAPTGALIFLIHYWGNLYARSASTANFSFVVRLVLSLNKRNSAFLAFAWKTFCSKKLRHKKRYFFFSAVFCLVEIKLLGILFGDEKWDRQREEERWRERLGKHER